MVGKDNNWNFTPSFGVGYYDDGNGKKLGNKLSLEQHSNFHINF